MSGLHPLDYAVIAAYFLIVVFLGKIATKAAPTGEDFFLAGRKLGKVYQFFLNFGNSVSPADSVSTASLTYQQGASGVWVNLQNIFLNPYYWFMYSWFRRVRLMTMADLFADRLGSRRLALFYAAFQIVMAVALTMGFGNLVSYKIAAALVLKPEATWTAAERQSVEDYRELKQLEAAGRQGSLPAAARPRLAALQERYARGELKNHVSALEPWSFYILYTLAVGSYIVMGGLAATVLNETFQGILIVVFSVILIPAGLTAIGGWRHLPAVIPAEMFRLFGTSDASDFTGWTIAAVCLATLLQTHANVGNMALAGSARNEFAARFGAAAGNFGKRILTVVWAFCGLIGIGLFSGANRLADPDLVWGTMSRQLLGPGLLGLMFAGLLASNMSHTAAQAMSVSALWARNIYSGFRPAATDRDLVRAGRWTIVVVLLLGVLVAARMTSVYTVMQFALTINVPFGAAILLMFIWRRVTVAGVWTAVIGSALINVVVPLGAQNVPAVATHSALAVRTVDAVGRPAAVFFEAVVRTRPDDPASPLEGRGRLHTELVLLRAVGVDVVGLSPGGRLAGRFLIDALLPLLLIIGTSLLTRPPARERIDQFFGKMKTPVGATPPLEIAAMDETRRNPRRFDHLKLWPTSSWEITRFDSVDIAGFVICCAVTIGIIALFWVLLRLAAP